MSEVKHTGIIRRVDDLGRIVLPKDLRTTYHVRENDPLEISAVTAEDGTLCVTLRPYKPVSYPSSELGCLCAEIESLAKACDHADCESSGMMRTALVLLEKAKMLLAAAEKDPMYDRYAYDVK